MNIPAGLGLSDPGSQPLRPGGHQGDVSGYNILPVAEDEVDVCELVGVQEATKVCDQCTLGVGGQLEPVHLARPDVVLHCTSEYEHGVPHHRPGVEEPAGWEVAVRGWRDDRPGLSVQVKTMHVIAGVVVSGPTEHVELSVVADHTVTVAPGGRWGTASQDVLSRYSGPGGGLEVKLEERIVFLGPRLPREDVETVPGHGYGKVAAGGRTLSRLDNFLPGPGLTGRASQQADCPHIVQSGVPVISSKDPQLPLVHRGSVGRPRHGLPPGLGRETLGPLTGGKLVLPQIISVGQVGVGVDVPGVATEDEHAGLVDHR